MEIRGFDVPAIEAEWVEILMSRRVQSLNSMLQLKVARLANEVVLIQTEQLIERHQGRNGGFADAHRAHFEDSINSIAQ